MPYAAYCAQMERYCAALKDAVLPPLPPQPPPLAASSVRQRPPTTWSPGWRAPRGLRGSAAQWRSGARGGGIAQARPSQAAQLTANSVEWATRASWYAAKHAAHMAMIAGTAVLYAMDRHRHQQTRAATSHGWLSPPASSQDREASFSTAN